MTPHTYNIHPYLAPYPIFPTTHILQSAIHATLAYSQKQMTTALPLVNKLIPHQEDHVLQTEILVTQ